MDEGDMIAIPCTIMRGGTSKGLFFLRDDLPSDRSEIEPILMQAMGTPDPRQINGLGGATSTTSKVAIIGKSSRDDADVDYTFAQVGTWQNLVDWGGNCGNISSAVGPYSVNMGLVEAGYDQAVVRIHNTNTGKIIIARFPVINGKAATAGSCVIPGVPGSGARIGMEFIDPAGSLTGTLLPSGVAQEIVTLEDGRAFHVSVVDAANPVVFLMASELGLSGNELPEELDRCVAATDVLEQVRSVIAKRLGLVEDVSEATKLSPGLPKVGFVSKPSSYVTSNGSEIDREEIDISARLMSMQTPHQSYMLSGAVCTGAAAVIQGTIVQEMITKQSDRSDDKRLVRIGHPGGVMRVLVDLDINEDVPRIRGIEVERTARLLMEGQVYVSKEAFK